MMREVGVWVLAIIGLLAFIGVVISFVLGRASQIESWWEPDFDPENSEIYRAGRFSFIKSGVFFYVSLIVFGVCFFIKISIFHN
jgi:hypothetical protein